MYRVVRVIESAGGVVRFAYADPPYLGEAARLYGDLHPDAADYDKPETHRALIESIDREFDGWALSLHLPSLRTILPMVPEDARICAWVKPFASFKPSVRQAYAWEPVIVKPLRRLGRERRTVTDYVSANIAMQKGLPGAKPPAFCHWMFEFAGLDHDDEFVDVFSGTGGVMAAWESWRRQPSLLISGADEADQLELGA